jgi:hypothetical protein
MDSGKEIGFLKIKVLEYGHPVGFTPDNLSLLAATERGAYRCTISTGATDKVLADHEGTVRSFAFSPDGKMLAAAASGGFITLRIGNGKISGQLGDASPPLSLARSGAG